MMLRLHATFGKMKIDEKVEKFTIGAHE